MTATHWGRLARGHWELDLPARLAALDAYFAALEDLDPGPVVAKLQNRGRHVRPC